jgi:hypothetical protein
LPVIFGRAESKDLRDCSGNVPFEPEGFYERCDGFLNGESDHVLTLISKKRVSTLEALR